MSDIKLTPKKMIIALIAAAVGIAVAIAGRSIAQQKLGSANWPSTSGVITVSEVIEERSSSYGLNITYRYRIQGHQLTSDTVSFEKEEYKTKEAARSKVKVYPVGEKVTVYYDPADPTRALLEPGGGPGTMMAVAAGAVILLAGFGFLFKPEKNRSLRSSRGSSRSRRVPSSGSRRQSSARSSRSSRRSGRRR